MCVGQIDSGSGGGDSSTPTPVRKDLASGLTDLGTASPAYQTASKPRGYSGSDFSSKYEAGKPLPAGDKNSASYWMNLTSTDGGTTLHNDKATALALEHGYKNAAYQIDHKNERQKAGIKDLDPAGFNTNFYKGNTIEMPSSKGHPAEGLPKTKTIPSDKQTINAYPELLAKFLPGGLFTSSAKKKEKKSTNTEKTKTARSKVRKNQRSVLSSSYATSSNSKSLKTILGR